MTAARRGDTYDDLADAVERGAIGGDGTLDPARLRRSYELESGPWLNMVGDLLAQVVGDAGSLEQASVVLAVPLRPLTAWVRWLVSRGSRAAARSTWPCGVPESGLRFEPYDDLADAVVRGAVAGSGEPLEETGLRDVYVIACGQWDEVIGQLLRQILDDAGSARRAAVAIGVPRSTFTNWVGRRLGRAG